MAKQRLPARPASIAPPPAAPEPVLPTIEHFDRLDLHVPNSCGFNASFNPTAAGSGDAPCGWVSPYHFGINEGLTVLMIENHRSGFVWSLLRCCAVLETGLRCAGFRGGWLD